MAALNTIAKIAVFNRVQGREIAGVSSEVLETLMRHTYPGNIRELENIVEHAFVLCSSGTIRKKHLPAYLVSGKDSQPDRADSLEALEAQFLVRTLERHGWNRAAAARDLGIHKTTLWRKMKRLGVASPPKK